MSKRSLKMTTAIVAAMSLIQPQLAMSQSASETPPSEASESDAWDQLIGEVPLRSFEEICAEAMIFDAVACETFVVQMQADTKSDPTEDATPPVAEGDAANQPPADQVVGTDAAPKTSDAAEPTAQSETTPRPEARPDAELQGAAEIVVEPAAPVETVPAEVPVATAEAEAETKRAETETAQATATDEDACLATTVAADGSILCVDTVSADSIAALAEDGTETPADEVKVTTETLNEDDVRASSEEFRVQTEDADVAPAAADSSAAVAVESDEGLTDLEKAGLVVLGALVVGAILTDGRRVEANTGDRVVVVDDSGTYRVLKDDNALLRQPGSEIRTERFADGSTRSTMTRDDGSRIVTIRDSTGRVLRRERFDLDGGQYLLIDDTLDYAPVIIEDLPAPEYDVFDYAAAADQVSLRAALAAAERGDLGRSFSLRQVRDYPEVRKLVPEINFRSITFATDSAALDPSQAVQLREMGLLMLDLVADDPSEVFLIEGHTDAVGAAGYNLLLSDRRAESVALALSEYFGVPAENMVVQGYGESELRVPSFEAERANRRVGVRRITPLLKAI